MKSSTTWSVRGHTTRSLAVDNATLYEEVQVKTRALEATNERLELTVQERTAQLQKRLQDL